VDEHVVVDEPVLDRIDSSLHPVVVEREEPDDWEQEPVASTVSEP